jgi:hypothetical protein
MPQTHKDENEHHCLVERPRPRKRKPKEAIDNPFHDIHEAIPFAAVCFNRKYGSVPN